MRIVVCSPIDPCALQQLAQGHEVIPAVTSTRDELLRHVEGCQVLVVRSGVTIDRELLDRAPSLRLVIRAGSGTDNLDLAALASRGIVVERVPGPGADAVAEMTIALMLALLRHIPEADRSVREGRWRKHELTGHRAAGRTLGIVGAGTIGGRVGRLGAAIGMHPVGCVERMTPRARAHLTSLGIRPAPLDEVLEVSDVVSIHTPLTPRTQGLIGHEALSRMRPGGYLLSLARGGVVDEHALREMVLSGHLAGAALDVHEHEGEGMVSPLADLPNVVLTPHIGAGTHEAQRAIGDRVVELVDELAAELAPVPAPLTEIPEAVR
jgi:D-3-phosphoglycerate dehydrogenase / 2-oxoglutarate reductase